MVTHTNFKKLRRRRSWLIVVVSIFLLAFSFNPDFGQSSQPQETTNESTAVLSDAEIADAPFALATLDELAVKGRAPKTGYARDEFGSGWATIDGCDMRNTMLASSLTNIVLDDDNCTVLSGVLEQDPYTGQRIEFQRGRATSSAVQIDHVVALSDAWQKGAQELDFTQRVIFANDPLNLLAVDGPANQKKGDGDAASWLPPNRVYRCQYVARQIAVKKEYSLWVTLAEKATMKRVLNGCKDQRLPIENN